MEDAQEVWSVDPLQSRAVWCGVGWVGVGVCYAIFRGASSEGVGLQAARKNRRTERGRSKARGKAAGGKCRGECVQHVV